MCVCLFVGRLSLSVSTRMSSMASSPMDNNNSDNINKEKQRFLHFTKYHGTGNDFVIIDDTSETFDIMNQCFISSLCRRRFGVGADGLILVRKALDETSNFHMLYFNADGSQSTMCGNGGRCCFHFARSLGLLTKPVHKESNHIYKFTAIDGEHEASISQNHQMQDIISLKMNSVTSVQVLDGKTLYLNTGSPHHCIFLEQNESIQEIDVKMVGSSIRNSDRYVHQNGTNVNFVKVLDKDHIFVRTFERGVEDETLSCGTGAVACAIAHVFLREGYASLDSTELDGYSTTPRQYSIQVEFTGGPLTVDFSSVYDTGLKSLVFVNVHLQGTATKVFDGFVEFPQTC